MKKLMQDLDRVNTRMAVPSVGIIIVLCGLLLIGMTIFLGRSSNSSEVAQEQKRLENALDQGIANVLDQQRGIAWWDEAVLNIATRFDPAFAETEFGIFLTETYGHSAILILDADGQPVFSFEKGAQPSQERVQTMLAQVAPVVRMLHDRGSSGLLPRPDSFAARQGGYQQLTGMQASASWGGAILKVDGQPSIVAAITISPNVDSKLLTGKPYVLVSVATIDQRYLDNVSRALLLPDLELQAAPGTTSLHASMPFVADDATPLGYLAWRSAAPGQPVLTVVLPLVVFLVSAIGLFSVIVLRRLSRASRELQVRAETARRDALRDALSDLPNRTAFSLAAGAVLSRDGAGTRERITIIYLDIDRFKDINDTLGHQKGDSLISAFAARLRAHLADDDFLARIGGDEFAIIHVDRAGDPPRDLVATVAGAVATPIDIGGQEINVTVSLGLAVMPEHGRTVDVLARHADIALYEAKRQGRDRAVWFTEDMGAQFQERRDVEMALAQAETLDQLELYFQPIVCVRTGLIEGAETLLRWAHPEKGMVPPSVFIPIAEDAGLMPSIGDWVLRNAVRQAGLWPHMNIAVNLSPIQFHHSDLVGRLVGLATEAGVDPARLTLEITEGLLLDSSPNTSRTLAGLREAGFKVALDDFGTGYSSLNYLTTFRFDKLKIDQCFVRNIDVEAPSQAIVQSVVQMSHALGMDVVAEGVETREERETLRGFGCDFMQGYLVSRPLPAPGFAAFAASWNAAPERRQAAHAQDMTSRIG